MPEDNKEKLLLRLKTAEGHLKGIEKMVQEDRYCVDVLQQLNAVISSLHKISELVLEKHLHSCVRAAVQKGDDEKIFQELMEVFKYRGC